MYMPARADADFPELTHLTTATLVESEAGTAASGCPAGVPANVNPAICDPASFEQAPDEFTAKIDAGFGPLTVKVWVTGGSDSILQFTHRNLGDGVGPRDCY